MLGSIECLLPTRVVRYTFSIFGLFYEAKCCAPLTQNSGDATATVSEHMSSLVSCKPLCNELDEGINNFALNSRRTSSICHVFMVLTSSAGLIIV